MVGPTDMLLLRCQLRCLYVALGSVLLGLIISPGKALHFDGRLAGVVWPMAATQVAQYAAVAAGLTVVLWLARLVKGRITLVGVTFDLLSFSSRTPGPRWRRWWRASWSPA